MAAITFEELHMLFDYSDGNLVRRVSVSGPESYACG